MAARKPDAGGGPITPQRAARLCRLVTHLGRGPQPREALQKKLKIDTRGFYRDLELLRSLGITVTADDTRYQLDGDPDEAVAKLPLPDPCLSVREARVLAQGSSPVHRKFRQRLEAMLGKNGDGADDHRPVRRVGR